jgi:hypothetical protein
VEPGKPHQVDPFFLSSFKIFSLCRADSMKFTVDIPDKDLKDIMCFSGEKM